MKRSVTEINKEPLSEKLDNIVNVYIDPKFHFIFKTII